MYIQIINLCYYTWMKHIHFGMRLSRHKQLARQKMTYFQNKYGIQKISKDCMAEQHVELLCFLMFMLVDFIEVICGSF